MTSSTEYTVIFAHPRTGSSNLCSALQFHPQLNLAMDPFWHSYGTYHPDEKNYVDHIDDIPSLERVLEELFTRYNGMKILDCDLPEEMYEKFGNAETGWLFPPS